MGGSPFASYSSAIGFSWAFAVACRSIRCRSLPTCSHSSGHVCSLASSSCVSTRRRVAQNHGCGHRGSSIHFGAASRFSSSIWLACRLLHMGCVPSCAMRGRLEPVCQPNYSVELSGSELSLASTGRSSRIVRSSSESAVGRLENYGHLREGDQALRAGRGVQSRGPPRGVRFGDSVHHLSPRPLPSHRWRVQSFDAAAVTGA
jgi:hypothetical protein